MHVEAQFDCSDLYLDQRFVKKPNALFKVREIVRSTFQANSRNSFQLFAIHDQSNEPVFHFRVRPPIRFTPQGCPLLLVSLIDHRVARQLIAQEKLGAEQNQFEFHRIITERVSKKVFFVRTSSAEEMDLLRYSIRVKSTRMRRGAWQSKNPPRGEDSPWMSTFISPLYLETIRNNCETLKRISD